MPATFHVPYILDAFTKTSANKVNVNFQYLCNLFEGALPLGFFDNVFEIKNFTDPTKIMMFDASLITPGLTRTYTVPNISGVLATLANTPQTFLGPVTFDQPVVTLNDLTVNQDLGVVGDSVFTGLFDIANAGDANLTIHKGAVGNNASIKLDDVNVNRVLFGLLGDDNFTFKVSADGAAYTTAFGINTSTGLMTIGSMDITTLSVNDLNFNIYDNLDITKKLKFQCSGITTLTTRTLTVQDLSGIIALTDQSQTISGPYTFSNTVSIIDSNLSIKDDGDNTKIAKLNASLITTATTRTLSLPDITATLAHTGNASQTFANALVLPSGTVALPSLAVGAANSGIFSQAADTLSISLAAAERYRISSIGRTSLAIDTTPAFDATEVFHIRAISTNARLFIQAESGAPAVNVERYSTDATGITNACRKARGTISVPTVVATSDAIASQQFTAYGGSGFVEAALLTVSVIAATPSATSMTGRYVINLTNSGTTRTETARFEVATGLSMFGANQVIDQNRNHLLRVYTLATLPTQVAGMMIAVSDLGGTTAGGTLASNGTNWKRTDDGGYETVGDADNTFTVLTNANTQEETAALTANRITSLSTTNAYKGLTYSFIRSGLGAFTRQFKSGVGGSVIYTSASLTSETITFVFDGTNWRVKQHSIL